jgi:hypothetical protein
MKHPCEKCVPPKRHTACWGSCLDYKNYYDELNRCKYIQRLNEEVDNYLKSKGKFYRVKYGWRNV